MRPAGSEGLDEAALAELVTRDSMIGTGLPLAPVTRHERAAGLGGQAGFGPVSPEPDEPVFHAAWERRALALSLAAGAMGHWSHRRDPARAREPAAGGILRLELLRDLDQGAGAAAGAPRLRHRGRARGRPCADRGHRARSGCCAAAEVAGDDRARHALRPRPGGARAGLRARRPGADRGDASARAHPAAALRPRQARAGSRRCRASTCSPTERPPAGRGAAVALHRGLRRAPSSGGATATRTARSRSTPGRATLSPPDLPGLPRDAAGAPVFPGPGRRGPSRWRCS